MEQIITTFGIKWELLLFQALNFAVVLFILHRFLYRPILRIVAEREAHIKRGIEDAQHAARELKGAEDERRHIIMNATREAEVLAETARRISAEEHAEAVKAALEESAAIISRAEQRAEEEKRRTIMESKEEIARMAVLAAERVLQKR